MSHIHSNASTLYITFLLNFRTFHQPLLGPEWVPVEWIDFYQSQIPPGFHGSPSFNPNNTTAYQRPFVTQHQLITIGYFSPLLTTNKYTSPDNCALPKKASCKSTPISAPMKSWSSSKEGIETTPNTILENISHSMDWDDIGKSCTENLKRTKTINFKVVSYNVLAQYLLESKINIYKYCEREDLEWEARCNRILTEVTSLDPDVICLQEVQCNHLKNFKNHFQNIGYKGIYKKKTRNKADGCAIFYKASNFELSDSIFVEFYKPSLEILSRYDNIGIVVKLTPLASPKTPVVFATTHLLYNRSENSTRLAQMRVLLAEIEKLAFESKQNRYLPVILTGDFNSTPSSAVIKLLDEGKICIPAADSLAEIGLEESWFPEARYRAQTGPNTCLSPKYKTVTHPFKLSSVYEFDNQQGTTFVRRCSVVDYIYYSHDRLKVVKLLGLPIGTKRRIPNKIFGSDHASVAAVFELNIETSD